MIGVVGTFQPHHKIVLDEHIFRRVVVVALVVPKGDQIREDTIELDVVSLLVLIT